ncbi:AraC family transcriptional regulator [Adhaeribacter radiodurans]|uniref:AraC family transcriptional regulator n=1 Tax=Adhaeribacter radiodurans TaxID=2745197 RepID=A0A7L7LAJ2_9BACT|nr:GyrI-like domain-containing protein [Adhaeribacter radiodurans]QMU29773.1 AraC family transcriptional regulator [Adhaeribacter radiodurans]
MIHPDEIQKDYIRRINLALNFIEANLNADLSLDLVSQAAFYSPYHFHRLFKAIIGEPLNAYISRRRIEKIASILMQDKVVSISELFLHYGFNSNSSFTRAFKNYYGLSPSEFRKRMPAKFSKISRLDSKNGQMSLIIESYICNIKDHLNWLEMNAKIEIKEFPELQLACLTHIGVKGVVNAFDRLFKWAQPKGLTKPPETKIVRILHDSNKVTASDKIRMSICVSTDKPFKEVGEIKVLTIKKGKSIMGRFTITLNDFEQAWNSLFVWMHENGYTKSEEFPFEVYHNDFRKHPENKCIVDFHIPII